MFNQNRSNGNRQWNGNNNGGKPWFGKKKFWTKKKTNADGASGNDLNQGQCNPGSNDRNQDNYDKDQNDLRSKIHGS
jgi:hypothetical protein